MLTYANCCFVVAVVSWEHRDTIPDRSLESRLWGHHSISFDSQELCLTQLGRLSRKAGENGRTRQPACFATVFGLELFTGALLWDTYDSRGLPMAKGQLVSMLQHVGLVALWKSNQRNNFNSEYYKLSVTVFRPEYFLLKFSARHVQNRTH
jgi:hypothetical protein